jgi:hypothetical protein
VADYQLSGRRVEVGRKRMGADWANTDGGPSIRLRVHQKGTRLQKRNSLEGRNRDRRLRRGCMACRSHDPRCNSVRHRHRPDHFSRRKQPSGSSDGCLAIPGEFEQPEPHIAKSNFFAQTFSFAVTKPAGALAVAKGVPVTFAGGDCFSSGSCTTATAASAATTTSATSASTEHLWCSSESVGLQLLRRELHHKSPQQPLLLLQLHRELLEEHAGICRRMQRRDVQPLWWAARGVLISRRRDEAALLVNSAKWR